MTGDDPRRRRRIAGGVVALAFLDNLSVLPILAPYARGLGADVAQAGWIVAAYSIANLAGNLLAGYALDRRGRRVPMIAGLAGAGLLLALYPLARTPAALLLLRLAHGAAVSVLNPAAAAAVGDTGAPGTQARHAGRLGAIIGCTALVAPPLGGLVTRAWGAPALFLGLSGLLLAGAALVALGFRETFRPAAGGGRWVHPWRLFRAAELRAAYAGTLGFTAALGVLTVHVPLSVRAAGGGAQVSGGLFGLFALFAVAVMTGLRRREDAPRREIRRLCAGLAVVAAGLALVAAGGPAGLGVGMAVYGIGFGFCFPATTALVQNHAPGGFRGTATGVLFGVYSAGVIAGQLAAGAGFELRSAVPLSAALLAALVALALLAGGRARPHPA